MKTIKFLFFHLILVTVGFAQNKEHSVAVMFSNNGHISPLIDEFYIRGSLFDLAVRADDFKFKKSENKVQVEYVLGLKNKINFACSFGYGRNTMSYDNFNPNATIKGNGKQDYWAVLPSILKSWQVSSLEFSTGLGIPFTLLQHHTQTNVYNTPNTENTYSLEIDGGFCIGISSVSSVKWFVTNKIYVNTQIQFGYQYANIGGDEVYQVLYQNPVVLPYEASVLTKTYTSSIITKPELMIGIGLKLNKI